MQRMHHTQGACVKFNATHSMQPMQVPKNGQWKHLQQFSRIAQAMQALTSQKDATVASMLHCIDCIKFRCMHYACCMHCVKFSASTLCYVGCVWLETALTSNEVGSVAACARQTARHLLWVPKLSPSQRAVTPIHEQLLDAVHISVMI